MKKLTTHDIGILNELDKDLLFNYAELMKAAKDGPRSAYQIASIGIPLCVFLGASIGVVANQYGALGLSKFLNLFLLMFVIGTLILLFVCLFISLSSLIKAKRYKRRLKSRGLDVSGLTFDQVFNHVAMPMFRRQGLKIEE